MLADAQAILGAAIAASHPRRGVASSALLSRTIAAAQKSSGELTAVAVLAVGKAAAAMALGVRDALQTHGLDTLPCSTVVVTKYGHTDAALASGGSATVTVFEAGHPTPDAAGESAARHVMETWVSALTPTTLVVVCISGGASALLPLPAPPLTLAHIVAVNDALLAAGADIREVNTVRKHLSAISGGRLGLAIRRRTPAAAAALVLSDVVGDALDVIASGPVVPDPSTFADAVGVARKYGLVKGEESIAATPALAPAMAHLLAGAAGGGGAPDETPKPTPAADDDGSFWGGLSPCELPCEVVGSNSVSLRAAAAAAAAAGYASVTLWPAPAPGAASSFLEGEAAPAARAFADALWTARSSATGSSGKGICLLGGGETTVTLCECPGLGGRNQDFAVAAAVKMVQLTVPSTSEWRWAVGSVGTDGTDGPTPAAGALLGSEVLSQVWGGDGGAFTAAAEDALRRHDSYHFLSHAHTTNGDCSGGADAAVAAPAADAGHPLTLLPGGLLMSGPTGTNVNDIYVGLLTL